jgi:hypothetical protein|uniref:Eukaryotic translation initiation factor 4E n=1 Tax=viral metagenome TaxID=1070528 RepID=A0A6C0JC30_9ZZZZ|tara:strand:- start:232 stop:723 length:492 start_codon:yes stop_codon:yes gene_type:complete
MEEFCLHTLNSNWTIWYHKSNDTNWNLESYIKLATLSSVEDFSIVYNSLKPIHVQNSMLFVMREGINPIWEAPENKDGGCFSFKIYRQDIYEAWNELSCLLIGENILKDKTDFSCINGISISPKKTFSIIKIWLKNNDNNEANKFHNINKFNFTESIYKKHVQ